tara:strand:+ start:804 stop:2102 length:1299 start_codon:yes stop_codon:yes gene_type:complete
MAIISWDQVKRNIPGVGDRAYIMAGYRLVQGQCVPNPLATDRQCQTFQGYGSSSDVWGQDSPVQTLYPQVGEYLVITQDGQPACYKVLEILDEATFNTGQCTSCYYNGYAGNCSDTYQYAPSVIPYPGDPNGCRYNNAICHNAISLTSWSFPANVANGVVFDGWITNDCSDCTQGIPPNFVPNTVVNCCDPSEVYILEPPSLNWPVYNEIMNLGVYNDQQAFRADFYIGGAQTGMKCWHLEERTNTFGASVISVTFDPGDVFPDCGHLEQFLISSPNYNPCCSPPPNPCPPADQNSPFYTYANFCNSDWCVDAQGNPVAIPHPDCVCCDPTGTTTETGCTLPTASLIILNRKIDTWKEWKSRAVATTNLTSKGNPLAGTASGTVKDRGTGTSEYSGGNGSDDYAGGSDSEVDGGEDSGRERGRGMSESGGGY